MSDPRNDGGQAFPPNLHPAGHPDCPQGMSLRDYFAGQAVIGIISNDPTGKITFQDIAAKAYDIADAMLDDRAVTGMGGGQ